MFVIAREQDGLFADDRYSGFEPCPCLLVVEITEDAVLQFLLGEESPVVVGSGAIEMVDGFGCRIAGDNGRHCLMDAVAAQYGFLILYNLRTQQGREFEAA